MVDGASTMIFFAFPREIRDLIYTHLSTTNKIYSINYGNITTIRKAAPPEFGLINTCKTIQYEMLRMLSSHNIFRFSFPSSNNTQSLYPEFAGLTTCMEIYIDLSFFPLRNFSIGDLHPAVFHVSEQVCGALRIWNSQMIMCESCRVIIRDNSQVVSSLLQLRMFEKMKILNGLETLLVIVLKFKSDLRKLVTFLRPSLGPDTIHYEWPALPDAHRDYGCVKFHPKKFLAEMREHSSGKVKL